MRIFLASDIHAEFDQADYELPDADIDLIVLAGDIAVGTDCVHVARWYQRQAQVPVIFVVGNHEYYRGDFQKTLMDIKREAAGIPNLYFLENESIVIDSVRFLGCTLWSDFQLYGARRVAESMSSVKWAIADFQLIMNGIRRLAPSDLVSKFEESYCWLNEELAKPFANKTVVITHFAPHPAAIHPRYLQVGCDQLTPYFTSDCVELFLKHRIDVWCYGHTHNSVDTIVENGTRLISNQIGYPNEDKNYTSYEQGKIICI